jgi:DnaJ-class molecular chaperone
MSEPERTVVCPDCKGNGLISEKTEGFHCCKPKIPRKCLRCKGVGRVPKWIPA